MIAVVLAVLDAVLATDELSGRDDEDGGATELTAALLGRRLLEDAGAAELTAVTGHQGAVVLLVR